MAIAIDHAAIFFTIVEAHLARCEQKHHSSPIIRSALLDLLGPLRRLRCILRMLSLASRGGSWPWHPSSSIGTLLSIDLREQASDEIFSLLLFAFVLTGPCQRPRALGRTLNRRVQKEPARPFRA